MKHVTEVSAYNKLSGGQMSLTLRCCGTFEFRHTMAAAALADPTKRKASVERARELAAQAHQAALDAEEAALDLMGETREHDSDGK
jgi:hypothetical protein